MPFKLIVPAFAAGGIIPKLHTCEGADISPSLEWTGEPAATRSLALILDDPDAPGGTWNHWLLYDLSPSLRSLPQGYKPGKPALSGTNDFDRPGYGGPCPPKGRGPHRYFFKLCALDVASLGLRAGARRNQIDKALRGHVLAEADYMGRYERR
ncbi:MAG: YbhB/YbcL family Raf kinase inhibitor-like protein [Bryobacteraceae bacterium]|jgi:Raf kinase inhibitor-like YbhB/YbcL family protein